MLSKKFKVTPHENKTLTWWNTRRSKIDMSPSYQRRGRLWSDTDKAYLIDSIINGFDVPKLYLADFSWGDSKLNKRRLPYAIIDGKQRLEAIFDFFDGKLVLNRDFTYFGDTSLNLGGRSYQDLRQNYPEIAEEFENYNPVVMSVFAQNEDVINELFLRLNRSKPLTGAEIRNAMPGHAPQVIRTISKHEFFVANVRFAVNRGQDLNSAAKLLMFEYYGSEQETKKTNLDKFVAETKKDRRSKLELAGRYVVETLDDISSIFLPKDILLSSAGIVPVYYWFIKNVNREDHYRVREFLVDFEERRRSNRELLQNSPNSREVDHELVEYDNYNRSTNDVKSHKERIRILTSRFSKLKKKGSVSLRH